MAKQKSTLREKNSQEKQGSNTQEAQQTVVEKASFGFPRKWRFIGIAVLVLVVLYFTHKPATKGSNGLTVASSPASPAWGPALDLEAVSKFDMPGEILDIKADAEGKVYVLTGNSLKLFSAGKMVKSFDLKASPMRSMAFDGKYFYITDFDNGSIAKIDKSLTIGKRFDVRGASRLLGIAASAKSGSIFASEVGGQTVYVLDASGSVKHKIYGPIAKNSPYGFILDLQLTETGDILQSEQNFTSITKMGLNGKVHKFPKIPWSSPSYERAAIIGNKIYMNCAKDQRVAIMNMEGDPIGFVKKDNPQMIGVGLDGFLYLKTGNSIQKLKPLADSVQAPAKINSSSKALTKTAK